MSYLVDGNNVMGQRAGWHRDKPGARRALLVDLSRFARVAGVTLEVVFDGAPEDHFPDGSSFMGVRVFYAVRGSNADERIKRIVDEARERRTLKVVTSDRALADYVRRSGVEVIRAGDFRRRLDAETESAAVETHRAQREGVAAPELDEWMYYFGVAPEDEEEEARAASKTTAVKGRKKTRK
ncbi:MAG: NYN domain-containing protein [Acidobacteria bacterium]|nr:NYN domain-containing protein [Acidobacteriota bacterium]